ncbi:unnamed protein product [Ciceribacter sp. T2.26MG-112.2]|uniref:hypothetical protein n=1 Tax=Ciceribacter sp. T2.26MG-112.2 TaxID=3137154 RepID=UPI000E175725|nr:hypothetical protein [Ciceribacter naphthalenivorans]SSC71440.1 unnamed protein product [Ciceribacter naphthalenivorans]
MKTCAAVSAFVLMAASASADPVTIVSWNIGPGLEEPMLERKGDFASLDSELKPDVIVMVEVIGRRGAEIAAQNLGWPEHYVAVSDFAIAKTDVFQGLEVAVISKIPIVSVTEYDVTPDGNKHDVFGTSGTVAVQEKLLTSSGISNVEPTGGFDRGTLRVDLSNGLTILPVHLKSNNNNACSSATSARSALSGMQIAVPPALEDAIRNGFPKQVAADKRNASERERVVAAVKKVADEAVAEGRTVIIAGDYNTSYEPGKVGSDFADCDLQPFECKQAPFKASACTGDGFDDTFAILSKPLVGRTRFSVLTEGLGRTYEEKVFADAAIDHIAVEAGRASAFHAPQLTCPEPEPNGATAKAVRACGLHGSDHFPIATSYNPLP